MSRQLIFKVGKHTDASGVVRECTPEMLAEIAATYDINLHEAPYVIGHPKTDDPAYGWAGAVEFDAKDGKLYSVDKDVFPAFADIVNAGLYNKKSASFYQPEHPNNPTPGKWYLRHVGFLGATPPAIKGLKSASFADGDQCIEFADWDQLSIARLFRRIRDWFIAEQGQEVADRVLPEYEISSLQINAADSKPYGSAGAAYAEGGSAAQHTEGGDPVQKNSASNAQTPAEQAAEFAEQKRQLDAQTADIAAREAKLKAEEAARHRQGCADFVEGLIKEGKLLPREKAGVTCLLAGFAVDAAVVEFGEGAEKKSATPDAILRDFLKALPKRVEFNEVAKREAAESGTADFAAPPGFEVNTEKLAIHNKALAHMAQHKCDYQTAVKAVAGK